MNRSQRTVETRHRCTSTLSCNEYIDASAKLDFLQILQATAFFRDWICVTFWNDPCNLLFYLEIGFCISVITLVIISNGQGGFDHGDCT